MAWDAPPWGGYFIVMDLIDGPDLSHVIQSRQVSIAEALRWTTEASDALSHAHELGIIHCDLKPSNLLLDRERRTLVTDFGLARSVIHDVRIENFIAGTAAYMAPEQVSSSRGAIGPRTDVYGLGAVLYALLTGRPPHFGRNLPDLLANVVSRAPVVAPGQIQATVPDPLSTLCLRCLAKRPDDRFASMQELRAALIESATCLATSAGCRCL